MYKLDITKQALKFVENLPPKQFKQITKKLFELIADPNPNDSKKLKGYSFKRTDIGEYRIIYRIEDDCIKIAVIGKRNDDSVYKILK